MDTSKLHAFVTVAQAGSLSSAAKSLGTQLSTLSRQVSDLEALLGVELLVRTGRGIKLTSAGERFLERIRPILHDLAAATAEASGNHSSHVPAQLRLSAPVELALRVLPGVLAELSKRHPQMFIDVHTDARRVSLLEDDFDAAIRIGTMTMTDAIARRVGHVSLVLCASVAGAEQIRGVAELQAADFVMVAGANNEMVGTLNGRSIRIATKGTCKVSTFSEAAELTACSTRVALLPRFTALPYLSTGRLVAVLPALLLAKVDVHVLRTRMLRSSSVVDELEEILTNALAQVD